MALTSSITVPSMLGIVSRAPAVDEKVGCFFCHAFDYKFVITETLLNRVIFKTFMVPLHRGKFLVVHLYSSFSTDP